MATHSYWKAVLKYSIPAQIEMRSIRYMWSDTPVDPGAAGLANMHGGWVAVYMAAVSAAAHCYGVDTYYLDGNLEWQSYCTNSFDVWGSRAGTCYPPHLAAVIVMRTAHKRTIGRKFIGPISDNCWTAGLFTASYITAINNLLPYCWNHGVDAGADWFNGTFDASMTFYPFTSGYLSPVCGSQRRRQLGHGI